MAGYEIPLLIASLTTSATSAYMQNKAAQAQSKSEAAWHAYNAKVSEREEAAERRATAFEAKQQKRRGRMLMAKQRGLIGASGVQMVGSPLLVAVDTARQLALENRNIRETGARRAGAFKSQSILDISKSSAAKGRASGYGKAAIMGAGTSILQGASGVAYMRSQDSPWWPGKK